MSMDDTDDLHLAEDMAGSLAAALAELMGVESGEPDDSDVSREIWGNARVALAGWNSYCRITCRADGAYGDDAECDETCGCPCHDRDETEPT